MHDEDKRVQRQEQRCKDIDMMWNTQKKTRESVDVQGHKEIWRGSEGAARNGTKCKSKMRICAAVVESEIDEKPIGQRHKITCRT